MAPAVLLAAPFLTIDYFDRDDLQRRLLLLGLLAAAASSTWASPDPSTRGYRSAETTRP